ncbi:AMP-binding protein [Microbacterium rhizosphaerae]|uniref:AMP-binding protein n=1 Tax=Microbacterium rhizosphaerae TaxID=1678237 RepID=A0ABZ0SN31_9MICO|nr:AMP-binding protein [Microbacterium rhizosphaerae]WPR89614.1 AMP-binding protein [Microbacterium rhizosphaerae]
MRNAAQVSYASGPATTELLGQTIGEMLDAAVAAHPDREALVECARGRRWTFAQLREQVDRLALGLLTLGIQKGDRVGIWAPNCAEWVFTQYATARIGAILVNVNPAYRTSEVEYVIRQSGMRLMVSATSFRTTDYAGMLAEIGFDDVVFIGTPQWGDLLERGRTGDPAALDECAATLTFDQAINIQYTSGTTGFPKGATLSHHNILNNGYFVGEGLGYTEQDRVCVPVPLYHCFGMVMGVLGGHSHGSCVVLPAPVFDAEQTLEAVHRERCTSLYGVPTMFIAELAHPRFDEFDLTSLRTGVMAGSPCPVEVMERVIERMHMPEVAICYGMTETSPVSTMTSRNDDVQARTQTIGTVMPFVEVKVIDGEGLVVRRGVPGEFCTRGYSVMLGYWDDPERTAEAIDAGRWMHTGDIATMDADGRLNIVGRTKDMILRGGENIYPREIEEFLYRHPDVGDVQVIGVPDERYGEEIMAWIVMRPGAEPLTVAAIREYSTGRLAHFKIPRYVHIVDGFPMTVTGKVRKVEMREMARDILGG